MIAAFPAAGTGERFKRAGETVPKPLIQINGMTLIELAHTSLKRLKLTGRQYCFNQDTIAHHLYPKMSISGCIHVVTKPTNGPLQTLLEAEGCLNKPIPVLIVDCDSFMAPEDLADAITEFEMYKAQAGATIRYTEDPGCSFVAIEDDWWIKETREKDPFTRMSSTGPYWFSSGELFVKLAKQGLTEGITSVAPLFNYLDSVRGYPVSSFHHLGTPETLEAYRAEHRGSLL